MRLAAVLVGATDEHYAKLRPQWPLLNASPRRSFRVRSFRSCQPKLHLLDVLDAVGITQVMYASDTTAIGILVSHGARSGKIEGMTDYLCHALSANALKFFGMKPEDSPAR